jgi:hypothetical protein
MRAKYLLSDSSAQRRKIGITGKNFFHKIVSAKYKAGVE